MGSGTEALSAAVMLAVGRRQLEGTTPEVILPAYGCPDLVAAVVAQNAMPVLVDLQPNLPFMDTERLDEAISHATVAVVGVGFLGLPERLEKLAKIASTNDVWLIEDSAQCFPPDCVREPLADCVVLSFGRGKPINLMGGGALMVREDHKSLAQNCLPQLPVFERKIDWKWKLRRKIINGLLGRRAYGLLRRAPFLGVGKTAYKPLSGVSRLRFPDELLDAGIDRAQVMASISEKYVKALEFLKPQGWHLFMEDVAAAEKHAGRRVLRYGILAPNELARNRVIEELNALGIGANSFYGQALPGIVGVADILGATLEDYPNAVAFGDRLITLPSHEDVTPRDVDVIESVFKKMLEV